MATVTFTPLGISDSFVIVWTFRTIPPTSQGENFYLAERKGAENWYIPYAEDLFEVLTRQVSKMEMPAK